MSGYERKKIDNALQTVVLGDRDSDCGTKQLLKITIPNGFEKLFIDRYILGSNGNLILLTENNIKSYIDKEVQMRSPLFCKSDCICNKCAGELFYKLGVKNAGLLNDTMAGVLMNKSILSSRLIKKFILK